jgi:hypothetical protein
MPSRGLSSFFGHRYVKDAAGRQRIENQFRILRRLPPGRWIVQLHSFCDGMPNRLAVYPENFLLSDDCALYPDEETRSAYYEGERRYRSLADQSQKEGATKNDSHSQKTPQQREAPRPSQH